MGDALTLDELARRLGETRTHVTEWRSLGLIGRADSETFGPEDAARAGLVQALRRRGIELAAIVHADRLEAFLARYVERIGRPSGISSLEEAAKRLDIDSGTLRRLAEAAQLGDRRDLLCDEDVEALAGMKVALEAGFPEEALAQLLRVYADALGRVAEAESRLFHFYVHERMRAQGMCGSELVDGGGKVDIVPVWTWASADRHQVLVTAAVRNEAGSLPDAEFVPLGMRRLRGLVDEVELFAAVLRAEGTPARRLVDPICGMELASAEAAARLLLAGAELVFCSQGCLQRFIAAPERYATAAGRA